MSLIQRKTARYSLDESGKGLIRYLALTEEAVERGMERTREDERLNEKYLDGRMRGNKTGTPR